MRHPSTKTLLYFFYLFILLKQPLQNRPKQNNKVFVTKIQKLLKNTMHLNFSTSQKIFFRNFLFTFSIQWESIMFHSTKMFQKIVLPVNHTIMSHNGEPSFLLSAKWRKMARILFRCKK